MPYAKLKNKDGTYRVVNTETGKVHMASGSNDKAESQLRLLHAIEHGWKPTGK